MTSSGIFMNPARLSLTSPARDAISSPPFALLLHIYSKVGSLDSCLTAFQLKFYA